MEHCRKKVVIAKHVSPGERNLGLLLIFLLHAWVEVHVNFFAHSFFHNKALALYKDYVTFIF
jgi:hypothetical protein